MQTRKMGNSNLEVSALGFGCMGVSWSYTPFPDRKDMIALLRSAAEHGVASATELGWMPPQDARHLIQLGQAKASNKVWSLF